MNRPKKGLKKLELEVAKEGKRQAKKGKNVQLMFQDEALWKNEQPSPLLDSAGCAAIGSLSYGSHTYAYAAVSPADGVLDSMGLPVVNAHAMSLFLSEVSLCHPNGFVLMVMDKAGWHQSKDLKVPQNMRIIFLPPYSPELNPAEHSGKRSVKSGLQIRSPRAWTQSKVSSSTLSTR